MKKRIITILCLAFAQMSFGQYQQYEYLLTPYLSRPIESGFFYFNPPNNIQAGSPYQYYKAAVPDLVNDMLLIDHHTDQLVGLTHYKYQQLYKNIPVEGAGCIEHYQEDGSLQFINAKIADSIISDGIPKITGRDAIDGLIQKLKGDPKIVFAWESASWEQQIRTDQADSSATWYPTAELIFAIDEIKDMTLEIDGDRYKLAYKILITTIQPTYESHYYYVDAVTGDILKVRSTHIDITGDVYSYGAQNLDAKWRGGFIQKYELDAEDNGHNYHTKKFVSSTTAWDDMDDTRDASTNWGSTYLTETSTHFHVGESWDYFRDEFGRNGTNGAGSELHVYTQIGVVNALYDGIGNDVYFGTALTAYDLGMEPSVVGHEFTHGVTHHTAGLVYEFESGALNESFSDIFGTMIQAIQLESTYTDWILGNRIPNTVDFTRSLSQPDTRGTHWDGTYDSNNFPNYVLGQPDYYYDSYYCDCPIEVDNGGVHINSGVQNKWFYILSQGNVSPVVTGIGMIKASRISYLALTSMMMNSSQFTDSREATLQAAINLYGECSIEHQMVARAWQAVGVGPGSSCTYTLDIPQISQEDLTIYPNPASAELNIALPYATTDAIRIYDMMGKLVQEFNNENTIFQTDISILQNGVYNIQFAFDGNIVTKRFIVQK